MESALNDKLNSIWISFSFFLPELVLILGIIVSIVAGLIGNTKSRWPHYASSTLIAVTLYLLILHWNTDDRHVLFSGLIFKDAFSDFFKIIFNISALLTVALTCLKKQQKNLPEYYALLLTMLLGAHLLVMSSHFVVIFVALELLSIGAYILTSFSFNKSSAEGSLKYFMFGSAASAIMLYGFSILYGLTGVFDFTSEDFLNHMISNSMPLVFIAAVLVLGGFLYKVAAAPFHLWSPDVYEAAPIPVVAFFSVVPKLAGICVLSKFIISINLFGQSAFPWQLILTGIIMLTIVIGNFSALLQKNPKRLMAYSSIAQGGFLLIGVASFSQDGMLFMLFYSVIYMLMNFLVFNYLQFFEERGFTTIASFAKSGKQYFVPLFCLLVGLIALTGLPPTAGFTAKLFVFSAIWEAYKQNGQNYLLWLIIFGLLNTVVALFYYLRIPYFAFIKAEVDSSNKTNNNFQLENLLGLFLVLMILILFFSPGLLMGWINKINFVL